MVAIRLDEVDTLISCQEMKISFYSSWVGYIEKVVTFKPIEINADTKWISYIYLARWAIVNFCGKDGDPFRNDIPALRNPWPL